MVILNLFHLNFTTIVKLPSLCPVIAGVFSGHYVIKILKLFKANAFGNSKPELYFKVCDGLAKPKHIRKHIILRSIGVSSRPQITGRLDSALIIFRGSEFLQAEKRGNVPIGTPRQ